MTAADPSSAETLETECCIAGGGPAGMMLGLLLARAGINTLVLEKHADFLRDFRGDTIHPSTLEALRELGLLEEVLRRPHQKASRLRGIVGGREATVADFSHLPVHCPYIVFMPQWDFLDCLAQQAGRYPTFRLRMSTRADRLVEENGRIAGLNAVTPEGTLAVRARLVVAADGRHSGLRAQAGLSVREFGAPIDALWMRLPRRGGDPSGPQAYFDRGGIFVMLDRGDYWQCAYVIAKGGLAGLQRKGLPSLRSDIAGIAPLVRDRLDALAGWDDVKLLTVAVNRLRRWHRPGFLCIGDAAHAMSPVGGVGINLAVQDAIAAANLLAPPLSAGTLRENDLRRVQRRREFPTRLIQKLQIIVQDRLFGRVLSSRRRLSLPWPLALSQRFPVLQRIPARLIGIGPRPEHVRSKDAFAD